MQIKVTSPGKGKPENPYPQSDISYNGKKAFIFENVQHANFAAANPELPLITPEGEAYAGPVGETVEEAAEKYADCIWLNLNPNNSQRIKIYDAAKMDFIAGADWHKQSSNLIDTGEPRNLGCANGIDPCPFCGAKEGEGVILGRRGHEFMITCTNCGVQTRDDRKDKVQSHWNRRASNLIDKDKVLALIGKFDAVDGQSQDYYKGYFECKQEILNQIKEL